MFNQISSSEELLHRKDSVSHKQDMLNTLLGTDDAIPLDNSGFFMLVRKQYFDKLLTTLEEGKKVKQDLEEQYHLLTLSNLKANKQLSLSIQELSRFKQNQAKFQQKIQFMNQKLKEAEEYILGLSEQLKLHELQPQRIQIIHKPQKVVKKVLTTNVSCQTPYQPEQRQISSINQEQQKMPEQNIDKEQTKLYQLLQERLNEYSSLFQQKIQELDQCEFQLQAWEREKENLISQNQHLRTQVRTIQAEEEKTRIWNQQITKLRENIEQNIRHTQVEQNQERKGDGWEEAVQLRGKLAEFRLRLRTVDEQMQSQEEIGDENAIVNLVKLTQRIKAIVRALLVQASVPE